MKSAIRDSFLVFSLTVIGGFSLFSTFFIFNSLFTKELAFQSIGAFAGALFAFILIRLGDFLSDIYKRQKMHYNSLVNLEIQLTEIGTLIDDNIYVFPHFLNALKEKKIYFNNLRQIPIDKSHFALLNNLELMNELFSYQYQLRRINDDMETMNRGYSEFKEVYVQKGMFPEDYLHNINMFVERLEVLKKFSEIAENATIDLLSRIRVHIKYDVPLGVRLQRMFTHTKIIKDLNKQIEKEKVVLQSEINESKIKSRDELAKLGF